MRDNAGDNVYETRGREIRNEERKERMVKRVEEKTKKIRIRIWRNKNTSYRDKNGGALTEKMVEQRRKLKK